MYDIRQFRPTLYVLLALGFTAFALATASPQSWIISIGLLVLHGWLTATKNYKPLPRWLAGLVTTVLFFYTAVNLWQEPQNRAVFTLGQFLVFLQLVKLFELRGNRDYAQLLVLSVLLVVAAAINSASLVFGLVLIGHVFVALYACLLFHLKLETDQAKALLGLSEDNVPPETLRQDQSYLGRSMRRLTGLVSLASISMAIVVFLFFPRGSGAIVFSPLQARNSQSLTGFSDEVTFNKIAEITQNTQQVAWARVLHNNSPVQGTMPLMLRGRTYDLYSGSSPAVGPPWRWTNGSGEEQSRRSITLRSEETYPLISPEGEVDRWRQQITLDPSGSRSLFAMAGVISISVASRERTIYYRGNDETLELQEALAQPLKYEVVSRNRLDRPPADSEAVKQSREAKRDREIREQFTPTRSAVRPERSNIDPKIAEFARDPLVSGADEEGPLALRRDAADPVSDLDLQIARNIESYLRSKFQYTLDLTDMSQSDERDPLEIFITETQKGHCEFFAGAMTLALQSLGIEARMVTGFRSDEFNPWGEGYYIVRQSHAHAWVEVRGPDGWESFDPTSGRMAEATATEKTAWQRVKHAFNYLEYLWAESVVAYDRDSRNNLISAADTALISTAGKTTDAIKDVRRQLQDRTLFYSFSARVMTGLVFLMSGVVLAAIGWFVFERWRLRQRARRIGLDSLPKSDQLRLARQLEFYDRLSQLLEARGIRRPAHQTPLEFSESISFLPQSAYDAVRRLTELFYRIRYGNRELSSAQQKRVIRTLDDLRSSLKAN